jgi:hypothetical protein
MFDENLLKHFFHQLIIKGDHFRFGFTYKNNQTEIL